MVRGIIPSNCNHNLKKAVFTLFTKFLRFACGSAIEPDFEQLLDIQLSVADLTWWSSATKYGLTSMSVSARPRPSVMGNYESALQPLLHFCYSNCGNAQEQLPTKTCWVPPSSCGAGGRRGRVKEDGAVRGSAKVLLRSADFSKVQAYATQLRSLLCPSDPNRVTEKLLLLPGGRPISHLRNTGFLRRNTNWWSQLPP